MEEARGGGNRRIRGEAARIRPKLDVAGRTGPAASFQGSGVVCCTVELDKAATAQGGGVQAKSRMHGGGAEVVVR